VVRCTTVALTPDDIGKTAALTCASVAVLELGLYSAQKITIATPAILASGFTPISRFALLAVESHRVVLTLDTLSGVYIAGTRLIEVDVVVALAGAAASSGRQRISEIVVVALIASGPGVTRAAIAHHILRSWVSRVADELTSVGKLLAGRRSAGAHAGAARDAHSQSRIPVVAVDAALAVGTAGRILTIITDSRSAVTIDGVSVAPTGLALRESVVAGLTLVAPSAVSACHARTLTRHFVAKV